ncbi:MAG: YkgJ family cysteine cluster protein [Proteobacteria bacterium]|nr:YkgJ family cysteine cluster protein [Pseudomonadota bacterium]
MSTSSRDNPGSSIAGESDLGAQTPSSDSASEAPEHDEDELQRQLLRGFLHTHTRLSSNYSNLFQVASAVYAIVDLLVARGLLTMEEVEAQVRTVQERLSESPFGAGMQFTMQREAGDKYDGREAATVDCDNRLHLCRAVCCSLDVPLSRQDIEEGILRWDAGRPYYLLRQGDSYCCHLNRHNRSCSVYGVRPLTCRGYSCAEDSRIWKDFAGYVPNREGIAEILDSTDGPKLAGGDLASSIPSSTSSLGPRDDSDG